MALATRDPGVGMVAAVTDVDVLEDLASFPRLYAMLEHACYAALVELVVDDDEGFAAAHDHACLCFSRR
jgi:hypothetical protein